MPTLNKPNTPRPAIPHDPLPQAADSLRRHIDDNLTERFLSHVIMCTGCVAFSVVEWFRLLTHSQINLTSACVMTLASLVCLLFAARKMPAILREIRTARQGIRGEVHISQYLEKTCIPLGYQIFHALPATGSTGPFDIDHALIGPAGIFSLETKNWSLPPKGTNADIFFDPRTDRLTKPDGTFDTSAVPQARNNAAFLQNLLASLTAKPLPSLPTRPVLFLPGWYVHDNTPFPRPLWILSNNALHQWLTKEPTRLSPADIALLSTALTTYLRSKKSP